MEKITAEIIRELAENDDPTCLSFYFPTARAGQETRANPVRLRNQIGEARDRLKAMGVDDEIAQSLLKPVEDLLPDYDFWQHQRDGLAILRSQNVLRTFSTPKPAPELLVVSRDFHLKPLLPQLDGRETFHVLALSQGGVRLLRGDRWNVKDVTPADMPKEREDYAPLDDSESGIRQGPGIPAFSHSGNGGVMQHGFGRGKDEQKSLLMDYLHAVDRSLIKYLNKAGGGALILAGPEVATAYFRKVTEWQNIAEKTVVGSHEHLSDRELHEKGLVIFKELQELERSEITKRLTDAIGQNGHASNNLAEVVKAAAYGRVDTAFIPLDEHYWGNFDRDTGEIEETSRERHCARDLLDFVAVQTILNGGRVFPVLRDQVPTGELVAVLLRY